MSHLKAVCVSKRGKLIRGICAKKVSENLDLFSQNDRMAADMAVELRKQNVACVSLWPGPVKTELIQELVLDKAAEGEKVIFDMK